MLATQKRIIIEARCYFFLESSFHHMIKILESKLGKTEAEKLGRAVSVDGTVVSPNKIGVISATVVPKKGTKGRSVL